ncbi:MAG: DUF2213 domain-containing protein [Neisseriaceae bacterium]|nr:DUF2213 domain-containing protein [Neisseriaceae bacterium]
MAKKIDTNGYWYIKHNPISKEGVFPYLGHTISDECEPNKIYKVYRPASTLKDSVETWDNPPKPFIDDHEMLGEGFTAIDDRPVQGIIYNPSFEDGVLYADIAVYSEDLKSNIENGKKELSLGYFCKYKKERGVFKGEVYDYVQYDMVGNHIALVDAGRCGSDVKVFDHKCTMDSLNLGGFESPLKTMDESGIIESKETKGIKMYVTIDEVRRLLTESFTYGDEVDPKVKLIMTALEAKAKETLDEDESKEEKKSEDSDEEKEEKKAEDKCGKDEDEEKESTDEDEKEDEKKETADSIKELMSVVKDMVDDIKKLVAKDEEKDDEKEKESEDGDDSDDESKEKETEDEDEDEETKKSEDSAVFVFGTDSAIAEDEGLKEYLK